MKTTQFIKLVLITMICIPGLLHAQDTGIKFAKDLTWKQVLAKAKAENKYVFVDCYTTWCGPCRAMDKEVFANDSIGEFMNTNFISVKVQMDKTSKDNAKTKQWYKDAEYIEKNYKIRAYPTYLFFAPDGRLVDKKLGYRNADNFLSSAVTAESLKGDYVDPYATYDTLIENYQRGVKHFEKMPYMIKVAGELRDTTYSDRLSREYYHYLVGLKEEEIYTKDKLAFLANIMSSQNKFFSVFLKHGEKVDQIMSKKGYAREVIYQVIQSEEIHPFLENASRSDVSPDWEQLRRQVEKNISSDYADWAKLDAKIKWYSVRDDSAYINALIMQVEKYGTDTTNGVMDAHLNNLSWTIFEKSDNAEQLNTAIQWMEGILRRKCCDPMGFVWDTYANLLYKVGRINEAIYWEENAIKNVTGTLSIQLVQSYQETLSKMKRGEPTWKTN